MDAGYLIEFLNKKVDEYNQPFFIERDPISIPHSFTKKQDIEIAGFFAAIFSWGNRTTIIQKTKELMQRMNMSPYEFCLSHRSDELKKLKGFKHRTFNEDDLYYFIEFFHHHYQTSDTLETAICDMVLRENIRRGDTEKKLYVMYDQMYWHLTYGDIKHYDPVNLRPAMRECTIYIDAISKVFASTGVRVGWSMGPSIVMAKMKAILTHIGAWAPMAEQKAVAKFLPQRDALKNYLSHFKKEIEQRLRGIYDGFMRLKNEGLTVDAIAPEAAIYLTIKIDLTGKRTVDGKLLQNQTDVTAYLLNEASLAVVPFYAFGASRNSPWYRLSVGTCKKEEINEMIDKLGEALKKLK